MSRITRLGPRLALLLAMVILMTQCGPAPAAAPTSAPAAAPTAAPTKAPVAADQSQPKRGGTLVMLLTANPNQLNMTITSDSMTQDIGEAISEGLIRVNRKFQPEPLLATSWEVSPDGKTVTWRLRTGVKWHDGKPFTSADVKYTYENLSPLHSQAAGVLKNVASIETPDDATVVMKLKEPFGPFINFFININAAVQAKHIYEGSDPTKNPANMAPIGTGPFKFASWTPGESVTLVRNPDYWDTGKPYLDKIVYRIVPDASARMVALETGEADMARNYAISLPDVARLKKVSSLRLEFNRGTRSVLPLIFNTKQKPLDDVRVRQALFRALDRELMNSSGMSGYAAVGKSSVPPALLWAYSPAVDYSKMYAYDAAQAGKDLDAAGFAKQADGTRFEVRVMYDSAVAAYKEIADIIRSNWAAIGVKANLMPRERAVWLETVFTNKDFDTTYGWYDTKLDPYFGIQRLYICSEVRKANFTNASQYCNPALDALFAAGAAATTQAARAKEYAEVQKIIANDLPSAIMLDNGSVDAINNKFGNIDQFFDAPEALRYADLYLK